VRLQRRESLGDVHEVKEKKEGQKSNSAVAEVCGKQFSSIQRMLLTFFCMNQDRPSYLVFAERLSNTVYGIAVSRHVGRSGYQPDQSPVEVSEPCPVEIPQREK
jgi:hypothetical protein